MRKRLNSWQRAHKTGSEQVRTPAGSWWVRGAATSADSADMSDHGTDGSTSGLGEGACSGAYVLRTAPYVTRRSRLPLAQVAVRQ
jgi:hypothetical protein